MMSGVTLTAASRQNLLALQDTAALQATTQNRLSTGKKVSSALDNPVSFFTAQGLDNRANDLNTLLDGISNGIQTIQAANQGITNLTKLVEQAKGLVNQALATQLATSGTASTAFSAATAAASNGGVISFYLNGTLKTSAAIAATDTIDQAITKLNTAAGNNIFSKDSTGTKIVVNASADLEFKTAGDQGALGFAAGSGTGVTYGAVTTPPQSADLTVSGVSTRASIASQFNSLLTQIDQLARDASYNGVNLINNGAASNKLHIQFNEKDTSNLDVQGIDLTSAGLSLVAVTSTSVSTTTLGQGNFLLDVDIKTTLNSLTAASDKLRSSASTFGSNLSVVQNRQDFTKNLITILNNGSANLTSADLNEEAANSQALSTRQSLGISALSLANTAQQQVLQLLR
ncbi:MAG: flagellin [Alsobacter sp.]